MEQPTVGMKRKSIFTEVVHLAGLEDGAISSTRELGGLDLRKKPSVNDQQPSTIDRSPISDQSMPATFHQKSPSVSSLVARSHLINTFVSPAFFTEPFSPLLSSPTFHDFSNTIIGGHPGGGGARLPFCWPASYSHAAAAFLSPLPIRSQFAPFAFPSSTDPPRDHGHVLASALAGRSMAPAVTTTRTKQAPRFQCPDCNRVYSTFSGLSKHRQFHCAAQLKRQFGCKFCQKHYTSLGKCELCGKAFSRPWLLQGHLRTHTALKMHIRTHTLPCKCELCGKAFSRPWLLQGHLRTHTGEKPFRCLHCGRAFADRSNLRAHLQTHSEVKKYRCACCQKTFSRMSLLTKHENNGCPGVGHQ